MVWGESQMDRGVSNSAEACAQPGCTPFPSCCRTTSGSPTLDTSRAIPWHAWVVLNDQTHKYTVIACCQWLCIGCCIVLSSIESLYYILYYVVTSLYSWLYSHMCFCVMKNILCWWWQWSNVASLWGINSVSVKKFNLAGNTTWLRFIYKTKIKIPEQASHVFCSIQESGLFSVYESGEPTLLQLQARYMLWVYVWLWLIWGVVDLF